MATTIHLGVVGSVQKATIGTTEEAITIDARSIEDPIDTGGFIQLVSSVAWAYRSTPTASGIPSISVAADVPLTLPVVAGGSLVFYATAGSTAALNILRVL